MHDETNPRNRWRRNGGLAIAGLLLLGVIGAVAQAGGGIGGDQATVRSTLSRTETAVAPASGGATSAAALQSGAGSAAASDAAGPTPVGAPLPAGLGAPKVVKTATLAVEVKKGGFGSAFSHAASIAADHGGFVSSSSSHLAAGTLVVRVPADQFDAARQQLAGLGKLTEQQIEGADMSGTLADLDARLLNLGKQEQAIRLIMDRAKTIGETIQVQEQLTQVREQIERLTAEQARLNDAVAMSTLTVSVSEPGIAVDDGNGDRSPLADSFERAVHGAEAVIGGLIVSLGYLLPLALVAGLLWLIVSRRRHAPIPAA